MKGYEEIIIILVWEKDVKNYSKKIVFFSFVSNFFVPQPQYEKIIELHFVFMCTKYFFFSIVN